jgi:hypothetical protein
MERRRLTTVVTVVDGLFVLAVRNRERLVVMSCTLLYLFGLVEIFFPFHTTTAVLSYFVLILFSNVVYTIATVDLFLLLSFVSYVVHDGRDRFIRVIHSKTTTIVYSILFTRLCYSWWGRFISLKRLHIFYRSVKFYVLVVCFTV